MGINITEWINCTKVYKVYVEEKADLAIKSLTRYNDKKGNVVGLKVVVTNKGALTANVNHLRIYYAKSKNSATNKKLVKLAKTAKVKSLKSGKSVIVYVKFSIPKKYRNLVKYVQLDYKNKVVEFNKQDNLISFK